MRDYLNNLFVSLAQAPISWIQAQSYLMVFCLLFPLCYHCIMRSWHSICSKGRVQEMSDEELNVYTKKLHEARYSKCNRSTEINLLWKLSGDSFDFLCEEKASWRNKSIQANYWGVFQPKIQSKENIWATKQPMKTIFLKNHYLYGKFLIILKLINRI